MYNIGQSDGLGRMTKQRYAICSLLRGNQELVVGLDIVKLSKDSGISQKVLGEIIHLAEKYEIKEWTLSGSRARGDHYRTSDIDLAVSGGSINLFSFSVDEEASTLLKFDLVNLDRTVQPELREAIKREGIKIYEKI